MKKKQQVQAARAMPPDERFWRTANAIASMIEEDVTMKHDYGRPGRPNFTSLRMFLCMRGTEMLMECDNFLDHVQRLPAGRERDMLLDALSMGRLT